MAPRFDAEEVLRGLTGFQRDTVAHVLDRFYGSDPTRRFLTADETGLGKSMVARGVIAGVIERLQDDPTIGRIDIVYVCSNTDIADQNLRRLNVTDDEHLALTSRLTLMAQHAQRLASPRADLAKPVNLVAFTPGTSFDSGHRTGRAEERALLHLLLTDILELTGWEERVSALLLQGGVATPEAFRRRIDAVAGSLPGGQPDPTVAAAFARELRHHRLGTDFRRMLDALKGRRRLDPDERDRADRLTGKLRASLAKAGVDTLEPDLVILDEFQRFRDLLDIDSGSAQAELAHHLFNHPDARVLLLSATPYKPFTHAEESLTGDDHSRDFLTTLKFLHDRRPDPVEAVRHDLRALRSTALLGADPTAITDRLRSQLIQVMTRVERPQLGDDGMLSEHLEAADDIEPADLVEFASLRGLAQELDAPLGIEYWKSAPYFANFLDGYKLGERIRDALRDGQPAPTLRALLARTRRLDRRALRRGDPVDLGNAKLRRLAEETVGRGWWQLLWLPPSLPYLDPDGPYAGIDAAEVTKRLVFSSWSATPRAVATLLSYEAARMTDFGTHVNDDGRRIEYAPRLDYSVSQGRLTGMATYALFAPNPGLATRSDPLTAAGGGGAGGRSSAAEALARVADQLRPDIGPDGPSRASSDAWYWWALLQLPHAVPASMSTRPAAIAAALQGQTDESTDARGAGAHAAYVLDLIGSTPPADARPTDLVTTSAAIGLHAPGNIAWRSLARQLDGDHQVTEAGLWRAAATIGNAFRSLFNRPDVIALLDRLTDEAVYWRAVLRYCADGNLQAVLDEYLHHTVAGRGGAALDDAALTEIAEELASAISLRPSGYQAFDPDQPATQITVSSRFALRYGAKRATDDDARLPEVRRAFNSPFWPFVLATTSVGQEGVDLHWWCHAIVHWNTPANPVDFEQREGRVHRYGGHAIRKNLAAAHGATVLADPGRDPWATAYRLAHDDHPHLGELSPHWVYPGPATIERHLAPFPLSIDLARLETLKSDVALYRLTFGQRRQEDMLNLLRRHGTTTDDAPIDALRIDLTPPRRTDPRPGPKEEPPPASGDASHLVAIVHRLDDSPVEEQPGEDAPVASR